MKKLEKVAGVNACRDLFAWIYGLERYHDFYEWLFNDFKPEDQQREDGLKPKGREEREFLERSFSSNLGPPIADAAKRFIEIAKGVPEMRKSLREYYEILDADVPAVNIEVPASFRSEAIVDVENTLDLLYSHFDKNAIYEVEYDVGRLTPAHKEIIETVLQPIL